MLAKHSVRSVRVGYVIAGSYVIARCYNKLVGRSQLKEVT